MKTRLLKKIRKRFDIYYHVDYPQQDNGTIICKLKYQLVDNDSGYYTGFFKTKEQAIEEILKICRKEYYKYSVKNKKIKDPIKVWYDGNPNK